MYLFKYSKLFYFTFIIFSRYGFNSEGHKKVIKRLEKLREQKFQGVVGVNLGKNKESDDPIGDYVKGVRLFGPLADYLVINVSRYNINDYL